MFKGVKSCSVSLSPKFCFCNLFMINPFLSLDTFDIADLDSTQEISLHVKNSFPGYFGDKE